MSEFNPCFLPDTIFSCEGQGEVLPGPVRRGEGEGDRLQHQGKLRLKLWPGINLSSQVMFDKVNLSSQHDRLALDLELVPLCSWYKTLCACDS